MDKHSKLKGKAVEWLKNKGFNDIETEVRILNSQTGKAWRGSYLVDIIGRNDKFKVAIECGGSQVDKLNNIYDEFDKIFIFPYGEEEPYEWKTNENLCQNCGHKI